MPNIKSAEKRVKVIEKKNLRNRMIKSRVKTAIRKYETAVQAKSEDAVVLLAQASSEVDKAASKGVFHKNTANRKKAQLAKQISV